MCDPVTIGLVGMGASLAGAGVQAQQVANLENQQNTANAQWVAYQNKIHQQAAQQEQTARTAADTARQQTLQQFNPANQTQIQQNEAQRLTSLYNNPGQAANTGATPTDPNAVASLALSGEPSGPQNSAFMNNLTQQVNTATSQARNRIAALASANSYGGSFGGLGTVDPITLQQGGNAINLQNAIRQSNTATYGTEQQVQPVSYVPGANMKLAGALSNLFGQVGGTMLGAGIAKQGGVSKTWDNLWA